MNAARLRMARRREARSVDDGRVGHDGPTFTTEDTERGGIEERDVSVAHDLRVMQVLRVLALLELVAEAQLQDPRKAPARRDEPERAAADVRVRAAEFRRVRQVEDLETDFRRSAS